MRHARLSKGMRGILVVAVLVGTALGGCGGSASGPLTSADYVLSADLLHYGASYAGWSARWWQWYLELPWTNHPVKDPTGADAWQGQVDPVWFLTGATGNPLEPTVASAERSVTVPGGIALFFPVINIEVDNDYCLPPGWVPISLTELRKWAFDTVQAAEDVYFEIDGESVIRADHFEDALAFRAISPEFGAVMPPDNLAAGLCGEPAVTTVVDPAVSDGIWVMLAPLPPGEHTLRFGGKFPPTGPFGSFQIDVVYHLTVQP